LSAQLAFAMDPFAILGIERRLDVDLRAAERLHRELSKAAHPDRVAPGDPAQRRDSLERAAQVNEAYRIIKDPVRRAEALFLLHGVSVGEDREPKASPAFLMDIMEQREALSEARFAKDRPALDALAAEISKREQAVMAQLSALGGPGCDPQALLPKLGELRFYRRFLGEVSAIVADWEDHGVA
jgi:molecular chaperone HscB